jgi:hypothetical protein
MMRRKALDFDQAAHEQAERFLDDRRWGSRFS